jgi:hypothetical protein
MARKPKTVVQVVTTQRLSHGSGGVEEDTSEAPLPVHKMF